MALEGVDPTTIGYRYTPVAPELAEKSDVTVTDPEGRFKAGAAAWILEEYGEKYVGDFRWKANWRHVPYEVLRTVFSEEEMVKFWLCEAIQSTASEHIKGNEFLLWKVQNSHHHYGGRCEDYNLLVRHLNGLRALKAPDGFEIRLTWSTYFNEVGRAEHVEGKPLFLDGPFGLLLYHNNKHVLTIGFALGDQGVYVTQVQNRQKKGNRWLFKLKESVMDMALRLIAEAFPEDTLWLVTGSSAVEGIRVSYGKQPCTMTDEDAVRIKAQYDAPLKAYRRLDEIEPTFQKRKVVKLAPVRCSLTPSSGDSPAMSSSLLPHLA